MSNWRSGLKQKPDIHRRLAIPLCLYLIEAENVCFAGCLSFRSKIITHENV
jgi:hypothetical protein